MTTIERFKEKLKAGEVSAAFALAISEAIELEITTSVFSGDISIDIDSPSLIPENESSAGYRLRTRINIVDGEVEHEIGSEFVANQAYVELKQLHQEQVKQGREILVKNLENLQKMLTVLNQHRNSICQGSQTRSRGQNRSESLANDLNYLYWEKQSLFSSSQEK
jgi:hypothetical protein